MMCREKQRKVNKMDKKIKAAKKGIDKKMTSLIKEDKKVDKAMSKKKKMKGC